MARPGCSYGTVDLPRTLIEQVGPKRLDVNSEKETLMRPVSQRLFGKTGKRGGTPPEICPPGTSQCDWEALSTVREADLFARQELILETVPFSLRYTIEDAMGPFVVEAQQKGLIFGWHVLPDVPDDLNGDPKRLRQILVNLVSNAMKFTEKGEIAILVETQTTEETDVVLHFSVRDTGIGIPREKQRMIFNDFTQADSSTARKYGGAGRGLTIASRLVEMMGGTTLD